MNIRRNTWLCEANSESSLRLSVIKFEQRQTSARALLCFWSPQLEGFLVKRRPVSDVMGNVASGRLSSVGFRTTKPTWNALECVGKSFCLRFCALRSFSCLFYLKKKVESQKGFSAWTWRKVSPLLFCPFLKIIVLNIFLSNIVTRRRGSHVRTNLITLALGDI